MAKRMTRSLEKYKYVVALIFPFWMMPVSLRFFKSVFAKNIFWFGCAFMGYIHIFNPLGGSEADSVRYASTLVRMHDNPTNFKMISSYFYVEGGKLDIYQPTITFIVSLFTANAHVLFLVFAIVFGYFYSRNVWMVIDKSKSYRLSWWVWIILLMFVFSNPIWNINGVRMYTAMQVFIFGLFSYYIADRKKNLIWAFIAPLFHFSFLFPLIIFIGYYFLPKRNLTVFFVIYFLCVIFNQVNIQSAKESVFNVMPTMLVDKANVYLNEDYISDLKDSREQYAGYIHIANNLSRYFELIILFFLWIKNRELFKDKMSRSLIVMFLVFASVFELLSSIPSIERYTMIQSIILYSLLLLLVFKYGFRENSLSATLKYLSVLLILPLLFIFRQGLQFYGLSLLCGNFISASFIEDRYPLIYIIKSLL